MFDKMAALERNVAARSVAISMYDALSELGGGECALGGVWQGGPVARRPLVNTSGLKDVASRGERRVKVEAFNDC